MLALCRLWSLRSHWAYRAEAWGTRRSISQGSPLSGGFALSHETRADHGTPDGHDRVLARLCGPGILHPAGAHQLTGQLPKPERPTGTAPYRPLGVPVRFRHPRAPCSWGGSLRAQCHCSTSTTAPTPGPFLRGMLFLNTPGGLRNVGSHLSRGNTGSIRKTGRPWLSSGLEQSVAARPLREVPAVKACSFLP
jgi:hypothetical protein